jgi:bacterial/archaeal transporter family protein
LNKNATIYCNVIKNGINLLSKNNWLFLGLSGIANGLCWILYFKALQLDKVPQVAPVDKLSFAIAIILSTVLLHEVSTLLLWNTTTGEIFRNIKTLDQIL